jgi:IclR family acetate operon transcriptional repressor
MSQAARRTLQLLELVAESRSPGGLMDIADRSGFDKSTAARLLGLLVERGWLLRDPETKKYSVGPTLVGMSMVAGLSDPLRLHLFPLLHSLREETSETISLQRRFGNVRICVAGLESQESLRRALPMGEALPLASGPSGKTILAFAEESTIAEAVRVVDKLSCSRLRQDLEFISARGYLSTDGDRTPGVAAVSVPIFERDQAYGSMTVAGPSSRFTSEGRLAVLPALFDAASKFTFALGGTSARHQEWMAAFPSGTAKTIQSTRSTSL